MELFEVVGKFAEEQKVYAPEDIERGTDTHFWAIIKQELYGWMVDTWRELEICEAEQMSELQARARTIREMLMLPKTLYQSAIKQQEGEGKDEP
jgi:hypothetical protein